MKDLTFEPEATASFRGAFLRPSPRIAEGQLLVEQGVKAAIDISDGLVADLKQICRASRVSARLEIERLPIHPAVRDNFGDKSPVLALSGGEDYELLFTASTEVSDRVKGAISCPVTVIGEIISGKVGEVSLVDIKDKPFKLPEAGWEHFKMR